MNTDSTLQRLVRKALTPKRRRPRADGTLRDSGVGVTGVVVTIVILGILAAVGGPPLFAIIFDAREFKLENNLQEAAQVLQQRLTLSPEQMTDGVDTDGVPNQTLITDLVEDAPYTWEDNWTFAGTDNDETIRVQFLGSDSALAAASGGAPTGTVWPTATPPDVDWIGLDWRAVRLHARNSDGRWACALIVVQAEASGAIASLDTRYPNVGTPTGQTTATANGITHAAAGAPPAADVQRNNARLMSAWQSGIWYDSGDVVTADGGLHDCSPVDDSTSGGAVVATLPASSSNWEIQDDDATTPAIVRTLRRAL